MASNPQVLTAITNIFTVSHMQCHLCLVSCTFYIIPDP